MNRTAPPAGAFFLDCDSKCCPVDGMSTRCDRDTTLPEASTFTRGEFGSTRSDPTLTPSTTEPVAAPRLRITYQRPFPFEKP